MPVFPASFNSVAGGACMSPCRPGVPLPRCGIAVTVAAAEAAAAARRSHGGGGGERRPCSDVVPTRAAAAAAGGEPSTALRSRSVGALASRDSLPPPLPPSSPPPSSALTVGSLVADLRSTLSAIHHQHPCLRALMDQLTAVDQLLKVTRLVVHGRPVSKSENCPFVAYDVGGVA